MILKALLSVLLKPLLLSIRLAASWLDGRKSAQADINVATITTAKAAKEIENEVEALDRDTLKRRASKWVRGPKR